MWLREGRALRSTPNHTHTHVPIHYLVACFCDTAHTTSRPLHIWLTVRGICFGFLFYTTSLPLLCCLFCSRLLSFNLFIMVIFFSVLVRSVCCRHTFTPFIDFCFVAFISAQVFFSVFLLTFLLTCLCMCFFLFVKYLSFANFLSPLVSFFTFELTLFNTLFLFFNLKQIFFSLINHLNRS